MLTPLAAMQNSSGSNPGSSEATSRDADEVVLQLKLGEPEVQYTLTRGDVRHLTLKSMASIWKVLVEKIGVCLPEAGRDPQGRLAKRVAVRLTLFNSCMPPSCSEGPTVACMAGKGQSSAAGI